VTHSVKPDRRVERTRQALLVAFNELVLARGYHPVTVRDIIARADIGRSTFYEHFESKDDLLRQAMTPLLGVLAGAAGDAAQPAHVERVLAHFWDNRRLARVMLGGTARRLMSVFLGELIEERLAAAARRSRRAAPIVPLRMIAAQLAAGQLALLESWLTASPACSTRDVSSALIVATQASASALLAPRDARA